MLASVLGVPACMLAVYSDRRFAMQFPSTGVELFDNELFKLSRNEAATIDPQQRLLLEDTLKSWSIAASNGVIVTSGSTWTGVFGGSMYSEYTDVIVTGSGKLPPQAVVGCGLPYLVGRLSYTFNFTGKMHLQTRMYSSFMSFRLCTQV